MCPFPEVWSVGLALFLLVHIGEQLQRVGRQLLRRETKTEASEAPLPLPDLCVAALKLRRQQQDADRERAGGVWIDTRPTWRRRRRCGPHAAC